MASLSLDNGEIVRAVLQQTGLGRDAADLDTATEADVRAIIRSGLRRFYYPVEQGFPYQWRWLEDGFEVPAEDVYKTGTIEVSGGTVTLTSGTWPTDIVDYYIEVENHILFVTSRDSGTELTVPHTQLSVDSGTTYEAKRFRYDLPNDFAEFLGGVTYFSGSDNRLLVASSEPELRLRFAIGYNLSNKTTHYAIKDSKILFWPVPKTDAHIHGIYLKNPDDNLPGDLTTPGSVAQVDPIYAEAVMEAILAAAESYNDDTQGVHEARFQAALAAAIQHDRAVGGAYDFSHRITDPSFKGLGPVDRINFEPE